MSDGEPLEDDEFEEGDDFDDDEPGSDEEDVGQPNKKRKKQYSSGAQFFLDNEAEVDESSEEDLEEEEGAESWVDNAPSKVPVERASYRRELLSKDRSEEEIARELEERHRHYVEEDQYSDGDAEGESAIKQQSFLPSVRDPKLWMIKCKIGKERITVINLMQKFLNKVNDPDKLLIKSAVCPDHLKGYIYVEAEKEVHVKNAIKGIRNLQQFQAKLVPIKEMRDVLSVTKKNVNLQKNDWVRVKRGLYRGDIAQVFESDSARGRITVKLIPRLEFPGAKYTSDEKRKRKNRVAARFFNPEELSQKEHLDRRLDPHTKEPYYVFGGNKYKDGYLLKTMNVKSLETNNVVPSLEELQKFQNTPDREDQQDMSGVAADLKPKRKLTFVKGDTVKVIDGDLKHLMGVVESVDDDTVNIVPKHQELHDVLAFPASQLQKYFKMGDHVKVISGRYEGETGLIVRLQENTVIVFSDLTTKEIKVLAQDIQECSDVTSGKVQLGNYELHDLVQINPQSVGVIVKVDRDSFRVLDNNGNLQVVSLAEIGNKRNSRDASSFDANQNSISVGDVVKVTEGQYKGRQGVIKHVFKYFVFLHSRDMVENSGIFVVRAGNCAILGGVKRSGNSIPNSPRNVHMSPSLGLKSPARNDPQGNRPYHNNIVVNRRRRDDQLLNKTVTIRSGQWKGYVGIVKDATDTTVRVELHTNCKTITVNKEMVQQSDGGASSVEQEFPRTPMWGEGARTPMRDDMMATPMRGDATPLRTPGTPMRTPVHGTAWDPSQPNTPMRPSSWESEYSSNSWTPDYTISTPGQYQPSSAYSPFSPAPRSFDNTPNSEVNPTTPSSAYTPGVYDGTPGTGYTPGSYEQRTPQDITTPYSYSSTPYQQPTTPATPLTPHTPGTPGGTGGYDPMNEEKMDTGSTNWHTLDIEVTVTGGQFRGVKGVIRELLPDGCKVSLENGEMAIVSHHDLEPVVPSHKGNIKIIQGELKGNTGVLIGIDGADGIVKMSSNLDIKILDLHHLAVYQPS